mmetsp:Transcript_5106/g.7776  ORF Transcript_5106/g.7776 Transcript_5106/m.7776 type:complete len:115 (+) Transcript_5106:1786-2130(+)|eukprot:CAMPEP_0170511020 /NCGR_PEP_ID=MMETSP0208-20121228/66076_1 /TAXON_ID=197538 /ORGANISM="Strombidium inclinatum, Strain S3" /LENGTH=114 /DNA_ID=CAMNT_0010794523 /DNA_START=1703 /DNA_END=2047 /DNA_ORIENTATION=+
MKRVSLIQGRTKQDGKSVIFDKEQNLIKKANETLKKLSISVFRNNVTSSPPKKLNEIGKKLRDLMAMREQSSREENNITEQETIRVVPENDEVVDSSSAQPLFAESFPIMVPSK